jgi:hypothetical protein
MNGNAFKNRMIDKMKGIWSENKRDQIISLGQWADNDN